MKNTHTKTHVKLPKENLRTITEVNFDWKDRIRVFLGFKFKLTTYTEVTYTGDDIMPFIYETDRQADLVLSHKYLRKPNWMKPYGGDCQMSTPGEHEFGSKHRIPKRPILNCRSGYQPNKGELGTPPKGSGLK